MATDEKKDKCTCDITVAVDGTIYHNGIMYYPVRSKPCPHCQPRCPCCGRPYNYAWDNTSYWSTTPSVTYTFISPATYAQPPPSGYTTSTCG